MSAVAATLTRMAADRTIQLGDPLGVDGNAGEVGSSAATDVTAQNLYEEP